MLKPSLLIICLSLYRICYAQSMAQLLSAESYHTMQSGPEKEKIIRKLEKNGWFAIDTFVLLDQTKEFRKTDLAPYIDDNGNTVFLVTDISPKFPGGKSALQKLFADSLGNRLSPEGEEVQNSIYIKFLVETDGSISEVEEAQKHPEWVKPQLIETCIKTIKLMPRWSPGIWKGKPVRVKMLVTINLKE